MSYKSVAEIFDSIDETRARLGERLAGLSTAQENFRPAQGGWSIAEIVEHLAILESRLLGLLTMMVSKAEKAGLQRSATASDFVPVSLDEIVERSLKEKYTAPETAQPQGGVSIKDSLERLRQSRVSLRALQPRFEATDLTSARYPHPAFGPLDAYQWLVMIGVHEDRHLRQIESLMALPEYQAAASA
ncbi:MAG TPA: DinB family protein [Pyrinomonadaceae bacterium]|nr:DinB family protein [Pyrinomonadaceae bacterium]